MSAPTNQAVLRRLYTGESLQQATQAVQQLASGQSPLPAAEDQAQERLEARVLLGLLEFRSVYTLYPLGISAVLPTPTTITLWVESEDRAAEILFNLLPSAGEDGEVSGVPGLRITRRLQTSIELGILDRQAHLRLAGLPSTVWRRAEAKAMTKWYNPEHLCWRTSPRDWTEAERGHQAMWDDESDHFVHVQHRAAWLGSGLLRRTGLLHTATNAYLVDGYRGSAYNLHRIVLRTSHVPGCGPGPQHMVAALTDLPFGLPLRLTRVRGDGDQDFTLSDKHGTALLELRASIEPPFRSFPSSLWRAVLHRLPARPPQPCPTGAPDDRKH
ncbi:hypothetical protein ABT173_34095 [Streptomyces sp. NPDC001795]|uniref:hypothetical protein n=1 Tax=Streptomyces sp. NPDC001795 TaxID=3154525 RepID=UPI00332E67A4